MQLDRQETELLFRLISEHYKHGSLILTSNKYFGDWWKLLSDNILVTALLHRLKAGVQMVPPTELPADICPA